ncbi:MAG: sulfatase, partial [bacterium]|nr:sulfatase [bacterium]
MDRRTFLRDGALTATALVAAGALGAGGADAARAAEQIQGAGSKGAGRPNILHIVPHDFGRTTHALGHPDVRTPNLDRLAAEGVLFTNHFQASACCSPGRGTLMTGRYAHSNGLMGLVNQGWSLPLEERTVVDYLNEAGYKTFHAGFQHERHRIEDLHYGELVGEWRGVKYWYCDYVCNNIVEFLKKRGAQEGPFYLNAGFYETHAPWNRPEYLGRYDPAKLTVPGWLPDNARVRKDLADFYGSVTFMDECIGKVLDALRETGLDKNTLVIFNTDHGISFIRGKGTMYDAGIMTALIMRWPGVIKTGTKCDHLMSSVDWLPSVLDLAGAKAEAQAAPPIQGRSFAPFLRGGQYEPRKEIFAEFNFHEIYDPVRTVRTDRWKYIRNLSERCRIDLPTEDPEVDNYLERINTDKPRPWE